MNFLFLSSGCSQLLFAKTILLEDSHEGRLISGCLEASMSHFGAGIDEFKIDGFQCRALSVYQQGFSQSDDTLLGTSTATLDQEEIVANFTIKGETTHRRDGLVSDIVFCCGVIFDNLIEKKIFVSTFFIKEYNFLNDD